MAIDIRIREAIAEVAGELGQDSTLTEKLTAWYEALSGGNSVLTDRESVRRHVKLLYDATTVREADLDRLSGSDVNDD